MKPIPIMRNEEVLKRVTKPGRHTMIVKVPMPKGPPLPIPVHVVRGKKAGPVFVAAAGEHGIEVNGVAAVDLVFREIDPGTLCGTLVGIPSVNPANVISRGFPEGSYGHTEWDTCRTWPGDIQGTPAERISAALTRAVMNDADAIVNIHCWSWSAASCAFTSARNPTAVRLTRAFGLGFVFLWDTEDGQSEEPPPHPKRNLLTHYALARGKPALLVELRTQHGLSPESVAVGRRGIVNVMKALGMAPGKPIPSGKQYVVTGETIVRAPRAGLFVPVKAIGDRVRKSDVLGYLLDLRNGGKQDIPSPCEGVVWLVSRVGDLASSSELSATHAYADRGDMLALIKHVKPTRRKSVRRP